jgi:hypothetical protein
LYIADAENIAVTIRADDSHIFPNIEKNPSK